MKLHESVTIYPQVIKKLGLSLRPHYAPWILRKLSNMKFKMQCRDSGHDLLEVILDIDDFVKEGDSLMNRNGANKGD